MQTILVGFRLLIRRQQIRNCQLDVKLSRNFNNQLFLQKRGKMRAANGNKVFRISDYDCVGFDLDNTLLRYRVTNMLNLEYKVLSNFLVEQKGHSPKYLLKPMEEDSDFMQKGLILDFNRGNLLRICPDAKIQCAAHGTRKMSDSEIVADYGEGRDWEVTNAYAKDMLVAWNGELAGKIRTCLDYFDMPGALAFARIVDTIDEDKGGKQENYNIFPDVLEGLIAMYSREHFESGKSPYFNAIKANPEKYMYRSSNEVKNWLKMLKKNHTTYLITGSHLDFANFTASFALGDDWKDYFHIICTFAKKPGFFTADRPFLKLDGFVETTNIAKFNDLEVGQCYTQGNFKEMLAFMAKVGNKENQKFLYVGDNLIQDVYTPNRYAACDTIAIVEEMFAEGDEHDNEDYKILRSSFWGSYFHYRGENTLWSDIVRKHAKLCVASVDAFCKNELEYKYDSFTDDPSCKTGYYPNYPNKF